MMVIIIFLTWNFNIVNKDAYRKKAKTKPSLSTAYT